jgi:pimeloyl-ACP methyl ester carboxylesterase
MFAFQLPWLPERMLKRNNWAAAAASFKRVLTPEDVQKYREAWSQPRAVTGMINYYRALFRHPPASLPREKRRIRVPTQIIWGARDRFLGRELAEESVKMCDDGRLHFIEEATHWVQHEAAAEVNAQITAFFTA